MSSLGEFADRLGATPVSQWIQDTTWAVPATQTVHILALSTVFFLMAVFDLQTLGVLSRPAAPDATRRLMTWLWAGLAVLAVSGLTLIIGEPRRELFSWPLRIKMLLIVLAVLLTLILARLSARSPPPLAARLIAVLALACWVLIIVCGRWVAYINFGQEENA